MNNNRDVLIHDYMGIDVQIVWNVIENELQFIEKYVLRILDEDE